MASDGQDQDWRELWTQYSARLLLYARQLAAKPGDAEDIVQDAFVRYWKARQRDHSLSPPLLFIMVKRIAIDYARKRQHQPATEPGAETDEGPAIWFEAPLEEEERRAAIEESLRQLSEPQREVLVLKIWGGLTFDEIGQTLQVSPHTAASRYRYALNQLKGLLTPALI